MIFFEDYQYNLLDRMELKYSVYVAALDMQYNNDLPYLWTFTFDLTGEIIYGRNWQQLREFFKMLHDFGLTEDHKLLVYLNDLTQFFTYARTQIYINADMLAKEPSDILIFYSHGLEFRDFQKYSEKDIDKYIKLNNPDLLHEPPQLRGQSELVELTEEEFNYSAFRVLEMTRYIRYELDTVYQGETAKVKITKTKRVEQILNNNLTKSDPDKKLRWLLYAQNPLATDWGLDVILPQLRKAFFGGTVFYEKDVLDTLYQDVNAADLVSAYCGEFILSKFPMSKFRKMTIPEDYNEIFTKRYYTSKALLIQFEAHDVHLKKNGLAIIPAAAKHYYLEGSSPLEKAEAIQRSLGLKLHDASVIRMCLTDIDFKLLVKYYDMKSITIKSICGARYGYLPDYIIKTVAELYKDKLIAKEKKNELEKAGFLDDLQQEVYNDAKTLIARLYGIFTQSPVMCNYIFDQEGKNIKLLSSDYIPQNQKFRPVLYQWGVWTTALVRQKLCYLRELLKSKRKKVLSGDTDCINYKGDASSIISEFNASVKALRERRCKQIGLDPATLKDLGELEVKNYKYYKITGAKQYAVIQETNQGDKFKAICGGLSKQCTYFQDFSKNPLDMINLFSLGETIPADAAPRKVVKNCSGLKKVSFKDRDGNRINQEIYSYQEIELLSYRLCDPFNREVKMSKNRKVKPEEVIASTAQHVSKIKTQTPRRIKK